MSNPVFFTDLQLAFRTARPWTFASFTSSFAIAATFASFAIAPMVAAQGDDGLDAVIPDRAIIRLVPGADVNDFNSQYGTTVERDIASRQIYLLDLPDDVTDPDAWAAAIRLNPPPGLLWIEADYGGQDGESKTGSFYVSDINGQGAFNTQFPRQQQRLPETHLLTTGSGVTVALLDTGLDASHELFAGRVAGGGYNFVDGNTDTSDARDFTDNDGDGVFDEAWGHGTFMGGLIMMMAPDAMILPVKVLNSDGRGTGFTFAEGVFHAIDQGVDVVNMSLGSTYNAEALEDAVEEAKDRGIIVVAAAGNRNLNSDDNEEGAAGSEYPALKSSALGVTSLDEQDIKSDFSNYGRRVKLSAPGSDVIWSAIPRNDQGHTYASWKGTSPATAIVAGAVALLIAYHPEWPETEARWAMSVDALSESAVDIYDRNNGYEPDLLGAGRIDTRAALDAEVDEAYVTGITITTGTHVAGDADSLEHDDGDAYRVRSGFGDQLAERHRSVVVIDAITTLPIVASLELEIRQRIDEPSGASRLSMWRWSDSRWIQVFSRSVGTSEVFNVIPVPNPQDYIDADGRMRVQLKHVVFSPFFAFNFESFYDQVKIEPE